MALEGVKGHKGTPLLALVYEKAAHQVAGSGAIEATLEGPAVVRVVQRAKVEACEVAAFRQRRRLADERAQDVRAHASSVARGSTKEVLRQRRYFEGSTRRDLDVAVAARR